MSIYDTIPTAESLLEEDSSHENELQAYLVKDVVKFLNNSRPFFKEGRSVVFYPTLLRDSGEYRNYWLAHYQNIVVNLTLKNYVTQYNAESGGLTVSVSRPQPIVEVSPDGTRTPIKPIE